MTLPNVAIAFDLSLSGTGEFFTIGDPTQGELGNATYLLAGGDILTDVTSFVQSVSVRRGKRSEVDDFDAGSCTITFDNRLRTFDPTNIGALFDDTRYTFDDASLEFSGLGEGSPYAQNIKPRKQVVVSYAGNPVFTATVDDWDITYDKGGAHRASLQASDAFKILAGQVLTAGTSSSEGTGARVETILDDVAWLDARRDIDTGFATLGADVIAENTNPVRYLQDVSRSEPGALFVDKEGRIAFRDRGSLQTATSIVFSDDGTGIPFTDLVVEFGSELLFNQVNVEYVGGTATSSNTASQDDYGVIEYNVPTFLSTSQQAADLAVYYSGLYSQPRLRVKQLRLSMDGLTPSQQGVIAGLELSDLVTVRTTPAGYGDPISQTVAVDGIEHNATPGQYSVTLTVSEALAGFVIGSSLLGAGRLGF